MSKLQPVFDNTPCFLKYAPNQLPYQIRTICKCYLVCTLLEKRRRLPLSPLSMWRHLVISTVFIPKFVRHLLVNVDKAMAGAKKSVLFVCLGKFSPKRFVVPYSVVVAPNRSIRPSNVKKCGYIHASIFRRVTGLSVSDNKGTSLDPISTSVIHVIVFVIIIGLPVGLNLYWQWCQVIEKGWRVLGGGGLLQEYFLKFTLK